MKADVMSPRPSPRHSYSFTMLEDLVVLFGGFAAGVRLNDIWVYRFDVKSVLLRKWRMGARRIMLSSNTTYHDVIKGTG